MDKPLIESIDEEENNNLINNTSLEIENNITNNNNHSNNINSSSTNVNNEMNNGAILIGNNNNNNNVDESDTHTHLNHSQINKINQSSNNTFNHLKQSISSSISGFFLPKSPHQYSGTNELGTSSILKASSNTRIKSSHDNHSFMNQLRSSTSRFLIGTDITVADQFRQEQELEQEPEHYEQQMYHIHHSNDNNFETSSHHTNPLHSPFTHHQHPQQNDTHSLIMDSAVTPNVPGSPYHSTVQFPQPPQNIIQNLIESFGYGILNQSFGETGAVLTASSTHLPPPSLAASTSTFNQRRGIHNDRISLLNQSTASTVLTRSSANLNQSQAAYNKLKSTSIFIPSTTIPLSTSVNNNDGASTLQETSKDEIEMDNIDLEQPDQKVDVKQPLTVKRVLEKILEKKGLLFMVLSSFMFSIMALLVKVLSKELGSLQIGFLRSFYGFVGCMAILRILKINPLGDRPYRHLLLIRGASGTASLIAYFLTLSVLPLAEAVIISFTSPVLTAALAAFVLKEAWGKFEAMCAFLSLAGVVIVAKPSFIFHTAAAATGTELSSHQRVLYFAIGIAGAFFTAISYITVRKVGPGTNPFVLVCYFSVVGSVVHFPLMFIFQSFVWPSAKNWGIITLIGFIAVLAQAAVNRGLQLEKASKAAAMNYIQIIFTIFWEIIFLHDHIDYITILGACLILSCSVITALKN